MFRKVAIAVGAVLLGLVIACYTSLPSLAHVKWNDTCAWFDRQVPIETQIKSLRLQADKVDKEIKANLNKLAKMEIEVRDLEHNVAALRQDQGKRKEDLSAKADALEKRSERMSRKDLRSQTNEVEALVNTYEVKNAKLKSMDSLLTAKRETLEAAHQKISAMKEQRDQLFVNIQKLETRKELVDIKTQQTQIQVSDSTLIECNLLLKKIDDQISEREKVSELYRKYGYSDEPAAVAEKDAKNVSAVLKAAKEVLKDDGDEK
jgi:chromosome segregation ATPase